MSHEKFFKNTVVKASPTILIWTIPSGAWNKLETTNEFKPTLLFLMNYKLKGWLLMALKRPLGEFNLEIYHGSFVQPNILLLHLPPRSLSSIHNVPTCREHVPFQWLWQATPRQESRTSSLNSKVCGALWFVPIFLVHTHPYPHVLNTRYWPGIQTNLSSKVELYQMSSNYSPYVLGHFKDIFNMFNIDINHYSYTQEFTDVNKKSVYKYQVGVPGNTTH